MEIEPREIIEILEHVPLFSHLGDLDLSRWAGLFKSVHYLDGGIIFNDNDPSQAMYIIYEGRVKLTIENEQVQETFANLKTGDLFGEEALLYDDPRYYQAVAVGKTTLLKLDVTILFITRKIIPGLLINLMF